MFTSTSIHSSIRCAALLTALGLSACVFSNNKSASPDLCSDGTSAQVAQGTFQESDSTVIALVHDIPKNVIHPTYQDLSAKAALLQNAVTLLSTATTDANLAAAQSAWRATRKPWEQSEAFLFGPVEDDGIDPHIDSWPLNKTDLDNILSSSAVLTKEYIDNLNDNLKGFHTIEYLLFDTNATKHASQLTARQLEYLKAVTSSFKASADTLQRAWDPAQGNFTAMFQTAGQGNRTYPSRSAAVQTLVNSMADICDEVANSKISDPFDQKNRQLEESQFSNNSDSDFSDNIRSVRNIYMGGYGTSSGTGLKTLLMKKDSVLAVRVQVETDSAIAAILDMKPYFGSAIYNAPEKVEAARCAVQTLHSTLTGPLKKALGL